MQRIFSVLTQAFRRSLVVGLISFILGACLLMVATEPSLAATPNQKLIQQEAMDKTSQEVTTDLSTREQAYEEQLEASEDKQKVYKENLKGYKQENPDEGILQKAVEGAKGLVDKTTAND